MKHLYLALLLVLGVGLSAQTYTVEGTVEDFHNNAPLSGAQIRLGDFTALTDSKGRFVLSGVPRGKYTLSAVHPSCDPLEQSLEVRSSLKLSLYLEHHATEIQGIQLKAKLPRQEILKVQVLGLEKLEQSATENLGNLLSQLSGLSTLSTGNRISKPVISGLYGSRIGIFSDGVRMAEQEWGIEHAPSIEPGEFDRVEVVKGAAALKYGGDLVGGAVVLHSPEFPRKDTLMGMARLSGISSGRGGKAEVKFAQSFSSGSFLRAQGSYKKLGDVAIPSHTLDNTGLREHFFSVGGGRKTLTSGLEISASSMAQDFGIYRGAHLGGPEDFYRAIALGEPLYVDNFSHEISAPYQSVLHQILRVEAYRRFSRVGKFSLSYNLQHNRRKEYDQRRGELEGVASMDLRLISQNLKLSHLLEREGFELESGVSGGLQDNFPNPETRARRTIPDYYRYDLGAFAVATLRLSEQWKAQGALRYDFQRYDSYKYYDTGDWDQRFQRQYAQFEVQQSGARILVRPILDYSLFSSSLSMEYRNKERFGATLTLSRSLRAPNAAELFADGLHHSAAIVEIGRLDLKREEVYRAQLSLDTKFSLLEGLSFELSPYWMESGSFIHQMPSGVQSSNRGVFMVWNFEQIHARMLGLDADWRLGIVPGLSYEGNLSLLRGDNVGSGEPLILMAPARLTGGLEWKKPGSSRLTLRLNHRIEFTQKRYPVRNVELDLIEDGELVTRTLDISTPPKGYSLLGAMAQFQVNRSLGLSLHVENLLNTEYRQYLSRLRYFSPEQGRNFIFTVHYQF